MSSFSQDFSSTSTSTSTSTATMEVDIDNDQQTQPQLKVPNSTQTSYSITISTPAHIHDQESKPTLAAPCKVSINGVIKNEEETDNDNGNLIDHKAFFDSLPAGYRFRPTKEELIKYYLLPKIEGKALPPSHIRDVNLYEHSPDKITERYEAEENEWYFFTPRDRKYPNGQRPNRAAGTGFWKATGADVKIKEKDKTIGYKKSLVYHEGKAPNGEKSNWIMHEYRVNDSDKPKERLRINMRLDDYVLCKIYKKNYKSLKGRQKEEVQDADTCAKDSNTIPEVVSSRLMNACHDTLSRQGASSGPINIAGDFPVAGAVPLNYGLFPADQDLNMSDNIAYQPSGLDFCYPKYGHEFEVPLPELDNFFVPMDDDLSSLPP